MRKLHRLDKERYRQIFLQGVTFRTDRTIVPEKYDIVKLADGYLWIECVANYDVVIELAQQQIELATLYFSISYSLIINCRTVVE
jgi:hypothetical protein